MIEKHPDIDFLLIASGLDDELEERDKLYRYIRKRNIINLNNSITSIKKARDIIKLYKFMKQQGFMVPQTIDFFSDLEVSNNFEYPIIFKKKESSGGINVHKITNENEFNLQKRTIKDTNEDYSKFVIQDYIKGIPISCTTISDGEHSKVLSINRQIIGLNLLNPPGEFYYNGNIVPSYLLSEDKSIVSEISLMLTKHLSLRGINGFDFVLHNHYPYLMEINPRIPGSIRVAEEAYNMNFVDLHIKCFQNMWQYIRNTIKKKENKYYATKLIYFAPIKIEKQKIQHINHLEFIHDKSKSDKSIDKGSPVCTILYKKSSFAGSFFGALKIADKINWIVNN
jgi:predicted ATP-grasp superfamily ATP-dependent carboligase